MLLEPAGKPRRDRSPIKWDDSSPFGASKTDSRNASMTNSIIPSQTASAAASNPGSVRNSQSTSRAISRNPSTQPSARMSNVLLG